MPLRLFYATLGIAVVIVTGPVLIIVGLSRPEHSRVGEDLLNDGVLSFSSVEEVYARVYADLMIWDAMLWLPDLGEVSDDIADDFADKRVASFLGNGVAAIGKLSLPMQMASGGREGHRLAAEEANVGCRDREDILKHLEMSCSLAGCDTTIFPDVTMSDLCPTTCGTCCADDPSNLLPTLNLTCQTHPCDTDLSTVYPSSFTSSAIVSSICPLTCNRCCGVRGVTTPNTSFTHLSSGFCQRSCNTIAGTTHNPVPLAQCKQYCLETSNCHGFDYSDLQCTLHLADTITGTIPGPAECWTYGGSGTISDISKEVVTVPVGEPEQLVVFAEQTNHVVGVRKRPNGTYEMGQVSVESSTFIPGACNYDSILEGQHGGGICATDFAERYNPLNIIAWDGAPQGFKLQPQGEGLHLFYYSTWTVPRVPHPLYGHKGGAMWVDVNVQGLFKEKATGLGPNDRLVIELQGAEEVPYVVYSSAGGLFRSNVVTGAAEIDPVVSAFFSANPDRPVRKRTMLWTGPAVSEQCVDQSPCDIIFLPTECTLGKTVCPMSCLVPCPVTGTRQYYVRQEAVSLSNTGFRFWATVLLADPEVPHLDHSIEQEYIAVVVAGGVMLLAAVVGSLVCGHLLHSDSEKVALVLMYVRKFNFADAGRADLHMRCFPNIQVALDSLVTHYRDVAEFIPPQVKLSIADGVMRRSASGTESSSSDELGLSENSSSSDVWASPRLDLSINDVMTPNVFNMLKKVNVTVMVANCSEFLKQVSKNLTKTTITSLHSRYLSTVFSAVRLHGGSPEFFWADRVTASFNAIRPVPKHCLAAAKGSLDIVSGMRNVAGIETHISIGLSTGQGVYGVMGAEGIKSLSMLGKVNSFANRFENICYTFKLKVVTGEDVVQTLMGSIEARMFDAVKPTNSVTTTVVWEILSVRKNETVEDWLFHGDNEDELSLYNKAMTKYLAGEYSSASLLISGTETPQMESLKQKIHYATAETPSTPPKPLTGPLWMREGSGAFGSVKMEVGVATLRRDNEYLVNKADAHERLLMSLLPVPIIKQLQTGGASLEEYPAGSVLFADIVGFTERTARIPVRQVVQTLVELFGAFDALTDSTGVTKIKTIGDCYMAATGIPVGNPHHADDCIGFALRLLGILHAYNLDRTTDIAVRIGVHSGSVIGGVIGMKQFCFDLWGDTVNVAARMETASEPNKIRFSTATYGLLSQSTLADFATIEHHPITVKGKGMMDTALVAPTTAILTDPTLRSYISVKNNAQASEKFQAMFLADYLGL